MPMARNWDGLELTAKVHRAAGRAIIGIGMAVAVDAKQLTHVISGTLSRSIHVANPDKDHADDESTAASGQDMLLSSFHVEPDHGPMGPLVEVGSWLPYACVEWVGRNHPGITQAVESVRGAKCEAIVAQAFREERLT